MTPPRKKAAAAGGPAAPPPLHKNREAPPSPQPEPPPEFPPNPVPPSQEPVEVPVDRVYRVVGPRPVGDAVEGEEVTLCLSVAASEALIEAGHVELIPDPSGDRPSVAEQKEGD
jgi:hypothetical protein